MKGRLNPKGRKENEDRSHLYQVDSGRVFVVTSYKILLLY